MLTRTVFGLSVSVKLCRSAKPSKLSRSLYSTLARLHTTPRPLYVFSASRYFATRRYTEKTRRFAESLFEPAENRCSRFSANAHHQPVSKISSIHRLEISSRKMIAGGQLPYYLNSLLKYLFIRTIDAPLYA